MTEAFGALSPGHCLHQHYRIEAVLGQGGFGITYRAVHDTLPLRFAIKEYLPRQLAQRGLDGLQVQANYQGQAPMEGKDISYFEWGRQRFLDEARTLAEIKHPNVVQVQNYFQENGTAYIVMAYEEGESLKAMLGHDKTLPEACLRRLLQEILAALEAVHGKNFLHRDIKPDNIYLRADGSAVLIDFGAARQFLSAATQTVTSIFSEGYSPPEQYISSGPEQCYGPWTDLYALGATLYHCIAGEKPAASLLRQAGYSLPPAIEIGVGRYSKNLLAVVDRAIEVKMHERFQNVAEMRRALGENIQAPTARSHGSKGTLSSRRWPVLVVLLLICGVGAVALAMKMFTKPQELTQEPADAEDKAAQEAAKRQAEAAAKAKAAQEAARRQAEAAAEAKAKAEEETAKRKAEEAQRQREADDRAFTNAKQTNTVAAYQTYIDNCSPICAHRSEAQTAIEQLQPKPLQSFRDRLADGSQGPEMVVIPAGTFQMGSPSTEEGRFDNERQHPVTIEQPFAIGKYEVTVGEFKRFVEATQYRTDAEKGDGCYTWVNNEWKQAADKTWRKPGFTQADTHPVVCVSWNDAVAYTEWLSERTGQKYRLPTEAEWEYAARAKTKTARYWGEGVDDKACKNANVADKENNWESAFPCGDGYEYTAPVGKYQANGFKLQDMLGNVWEWTCSEYDEKYSGAEKICISNNNASYRRVLRGGSWGSGPRWVRAATRDWLAPAGRNFNLGFRLARTF